MNFTLIVCLAFLSSLPVAYAQSSYGIFMVVKGDIKVQKSGSETQAAKVSTKVHPGDTVLSGAESRAKIVMNDRNVIYVSPNTSLKIAQYNDGAKGGAKNVELELGHGRVLNNVQQKYDGDKNKFIIKTPTAVAGVRGTSFITSFNPVTRVTEVVTQTGVVSFASITRNGLSPQVQIKRGETSLSKPGVAAPTVPTTVPQDQLKNLEGDVTGRVNSQEANPSNDLKTSSDSSSRDPQSTDGKKSASIDDAGFRLNDKKDVAPEAIEKIPDAVAAPLPGTTPAGTVNRPPPASLVNDVIRNKTDKTKVQIIPQRPN